MCACLPGAADLQYYDCGALWSSILTLRLPQDHLVPELVKAVKDGSKEALLTFLHKETDSGIYSLEVFTLKFCTYSPSFSFSQCSGGWPRCRWSDEKVSLCVCVCCVLWPTES
jgi:hypothetical protein